MLDQNSVKIKTALLKGKVATRQNFSIALMFSYVGCSLLLFTFPKEMV